MNILEALKAAEEGTYIRCDIECSVYYIIQTTLEPFGDKTLMKIQLDYTYEDKMPSELSDLEYQELDSVCLSAVRSELYTIVTSEDIISEIQAWWKEENT